MNDWQMQEAKARLSDLVKQAGSEGPQTITLHGRAVAVVMSAEEYDRLTAASESLFDFMQRSPLRELEALEFPRDRSLSRDVGCSELAARQQRAVGAGAGNRYLILGAKFCRSALHIPNVFA